MTKNNELRVYFGGSFFPPHIGHSQMLEALLADPLVDFVHLVPTSQNPLKLVSHILDQNSQPLSSQMLKKQFLELWLQNLKSREVPGLDKLIVESVELDKGDSEASFTVDTLATLKKRHGGSWALCLGSDSLQFLHKWKNIDALLSELNSVWVFLRAEASIASALDLLNTSLAQVLSIRWMSQEIINVSSTQIRDYLGATDALQNIPSSWLLPEIRKALASFKIGA